MTMTWVVHKFGGTCLADAERIANAARLGLSDSDASLAMVVSAMAGVTDNLIRAMELAADQDDGYEVLLGELRDQNVEAAKSLAGDGTGPIIDAIDADLKDIGDVLRGIRVSRSYTEQAADLISGYGEIWSARILCAHLNHLGIAAEWVNARDIIIVTHGETGPAVDWAKTEVNLSRWQEQASPRHVVITGYIASTPEGEPTTLKRNGSDFSASIFAKLLGARSITIWTDVDGVMSADPRRVPEAVVLDSLSYTEAMELAYFGAKVLHPHTMEPAIEGEIPIRIRNAFREEAPGTIVHTRKEARGKISSREAVKGISSMEGVALINVEGAGMIGVPGVSSRLFSALREVEVSVVMISQASSEHSICFAVPQDQGEAARAVLERAFAAELLHGQIQTVDLSGPYSILAAVGDSMVETPGVSARFFGALGKAGVNVRAVAQGSSERNISVVIAEHDSARALRAVHAAFYLSDRTLSLGLVGPGLIGSELISQLRSQASTLHDRFQVGLRVRGIATSKRMLLDDHGIDLQCWEDLLGERGVPIDMDAFTDHVHADHLPHAVMLDCTASDEVADRYAGWLERGIHVITPNKKANAAPLSSYLRLQDLGRKLNTHYLYEATVGAGLPVITTLRDLVQTGDKILKIEGVLSGTLSFLFNSFVPGRPFSEIVKEARSLGYTEPDPREDLSGTDVARKAVILAREAGFGIELADIPVQSLVPTALEGEEDAEDFVAGLAAHDDDMERLRVDAESAGEVLRYVAVVSSDGEARVELRRFGQTHAFARTCGGDNVIAFTTERYSEQPLIVQGPGAGPAVTAGGVFADLLRLASYLGAPS